MPRRAIISLLIALVGTLTAPAASWGAEVKNNRFQPGRSLKPVVLKPSGMAVMRPAVRRSRPSVTRIKPVVFGSGRTTVLKPAATAVSLAVSGRKP